MTPEEEYTAFIRDKHCPYMFADRRAAIEQGAIVLYQKDKEIYDAEVELLEKMGATFLASIPDAPTSKSKFKSMKIDRDCKAMKLYLDATQEYHNETPW